MVDRMPSRRAMSTTRWAPISMLSWAKTVFSELRVARMRVTSSASGSAAGSPLPSDGSHDQVGMASRHLDPVGEQALPVEVVPSVGHPLGEVHGLVRDLGLPVPCLLLRPGWSLRGRLERRCGPPVGELEEGLEAVFEAGLGGVVAAHPPVTRQTLLSSSAPGSRTPGRWVAV